MPPAPFPPPRPQPGGPTTDMDADFPNLGLRLRLRASWDFFDAAQQVLAAWTQLGRAPRHGGNIALGFSVYFAHQNAPDTFTITAPNYRGNGLTEQTDDLSEALWIHTAQLELAHLTGTPPLASRLDHLVDVSPGARADLSNPGARFRLRREQPRTLPTGATHTGWVITRADETDAATAVEQIGAAELAHDAPTLVTALALPPHHVVLVAGDTFERVSVIATPADGGQPAPRVIVDWRPTTPVRETVSYTAHGIEFFTEVDPEYRAEALQILRVVDQREPGMFVDNYALDFGFVFLVFRSVGDGRMRVKTTDVSKPGIDTTTPDLTWAAALRRRQLETNRMLGRPAWTDLRSCMVTMRVHPGALDGPQVTMRREPPTGMDSGWVIGSGTGEPQVLAAHEVRFRQPGTAACFPLPPGFEVTLIDGQLERVLDGAGALVWSRG